MFEVDVNLWAVLVATAVYFAVGGLWFSVLFGKQWMKLSKITMEEASKSSSAGLYVGLFFTAAGSHIHPGLFGGSYRCGDCC